MIAQLNKLQKWANISCEKFERMEKEEKKSHTRVHTLKKQLSRAIIIIKEEENDLKAIKKR